MTTLYLIFNHTFTSSQEKDAKESLGVKKIVELPTDLKKIWASIPPDLPDISEFIKPVKNWLAGCSRKGDYVLIQGDFGACFIMVNKAFEQGLIPVYSTTERKYEEKRLPDGSISLVHKFMHCIFRKFERKL